MELYQKFPCVCSAAAPFACITSGNYLIIAQSSRYRDLLSSIAMFDMLSDKIKMRDNLPMFDTLKNIPSLWKSPGSSGDSSHPDLGFMTIRKVGESPRDWTLSVWDMNINIMHETTSMNGEITSKICIGDRFILVGELIIDVDIIHRIRIVYFQNNELKHKSIYESFGQLFLPSTGNIFLEEAYGGGIHIYGIENYESILYYSFDPGRSSPLEIYCDNDIVHIVMHDGYQDSYYYYTFNIDNMTLENRTVLYGESPMVGWADAVFAENYIITTSCDHICLWDKKRNLLDLSITKRAERPSISEKNVIKYFRVCGRIGVEVWAVRTISLFDLCIKFLKKNKHIINKSKLPQEILDKLDRS